MTVLPGARWRVLTPEGGPEEGPAEALLAEGIRLLEGLSHDPTPVLRWYRATTPALVLGRGQRPAAMTAASLPVVDRFTGGGAVLMDQDLLSLDLVLPAGHRLLEGDLSAVFLRVGHAWANALGELGVPELAVHEGPARARRSGTDRERLLAAVCYATLGRGEVTAAGRKIVGLAQRRRRPGALIQCGLLRRWRPGPLLAALGADPEDPVIRAAAIGIDEILAVPPADETLMAFVQRHLTR